MRVRIPGNQGVHEMHVGHSVLSFGKDGYAEADHLSDVELQRCIDFHFVVEGVRSKAKAETPKDSSLPFDEEDSTSDDQATEDAASVEGDGETRPKTRKPRSPRKGKGAS